MKTKYKKRYPNVLLVGRTNVGKSTLFNRLADKTQSIVLELDGVTRDYVEETVSWNKKTFNLIDTGGLSFKKNRHDIEKKVQEKVLTLLNKTHLILFVCDAKSGLVQEDVHIAKTLHKSKKPVFVLLNKADNKVSEENRHEFYSLGFDKIIPVSGIHGMGMVELLENVTTSLPDIAEKTIEKPSQNIVIIGKPNVGKSSLMNLLIHQERSIVSDVAGTTREAISEKVWHSQDLLQITDTAGVRRKCRINENLETLMVKSSLQSIKAADIVLVMIDASAGKISDQELKLLFHAYESKKPLLVLFNKTDLLKDNDYHKDLLLESIEEYDFILKKVPQIAISCVSKKNVHKILEQVQKVIERCQQPFNSTRVDEAVKCELAKKQLYHKRQKLKLFKIRNIQGIIPTFVLHVNYPQWFGPTQLGFIENILRRHYDLKGCPVEFFIRSV